MATTFPYWRRKHPEQAKGHKLVRRARRNFSFYGNRCYYCGVELQSRLNRTVDHRIPLSRGGTHWPSNLVPACRSCNSAKHDRTELEFRVEGLIKFGDLSQSLPA